MHDIVSQNNDLLDAYFTPGHFGDCLRLISASPRLRLCLQSLILLCAEMPRRFPFSRAFDDRLQIYICDTSDDEFRVLAIASGANRLLMLRHYFIFLLSSAGGYFD